MSSYEQLGTSDRVRVNAAILTEMQQNPQFIDQMREKLDTHDPAAREAGFQKMLDKVRDILAIDIDKLPALQETADATDLGRQKELLRRVKGLVASEVYTLDVATPEYRPYKAEKYQAMAADSGNEFDLPKLAGEYHMQTDTVRMAQSLVTADNFAAPGSSLPHKIASNEIANQRH